MTDNQLQGNTAGKHTKVADKQACDETYGQRVISLTVAYDGGAFHGFARQPGQPTVQGAIEDALKVVYRRDVLTVGAGRTDAGVHANGQVVSFQISDNEFNARTAQKLAYSLNAIVPRGISIRGAQERPSGFSARFSARERVYRYRICIDDARPVFTAPYVWWLPARKAPDGRMAIRAMDEAARYLIGEHDFKSFCVAKSADGMPTCRCVRSIEFFKAQHLGERCIVIEVAGNAFLHSMVRVIVGSLVEVGMQRKDPMWIKDVLAARDRTAAGQTAPACGLTFWRVVY
ncbi:MAG: tRNA pseudouridine(38-40) synthase TruA [Coriobacteriales bacterium]|nr:tRNA pseudouridine(38-40) synthase TruA [Coriobacteriales bacterium]